MIENLEDFIDAFEEVKLLNWVPTHRSGSTGVGKTFGRFIGNTRE